MAAEQVVFGAVAPNAATAQFGSILRQHAATIPLRGAGVYIAPAGLTLVDLFGPPLYRSVTATAKEVGGKTGIPVGLFAQGLYQLHTGPELRELGARALVPRMDDVQFLAKTAQERMMSDDDVRAMRRWTGLPEGQEHLIDSYGSALGFGPVRQEWTNFAQSILGVKQIGFENTLAIDTGSAGAIALVAMMLYAEQPGPLAVFNPRFPGYVSPHKTYMRPLVNKLVLLATKQEGDTFVDDLEHLEVALEHHRPKLLIISDPDNPTGRVRDAATLTKIIDLCKKFGCHLHMEWTYSTMLFNGTKFAGLPDSYSNWPDHVTASATISKMFLQSGLRGAAVYGSPATVARLSAYVNDLAICPSVDVQIKSASLLHSNAPQYFKDLNAEIEVRRGIVREQFESLGFKVILPDGTGYALVKVPPDLQMVDTAWMAELFASHGLAIAPGARDFGLPNGCFRVSLVRPIPELRLIRERIGRAIPEVEAFMRASYDVIDVN